MYGRRFRGATRKRWHSRYYAPNQSLKKNESKKKIMETRQRGTKTNKAGEILIAAVGSPSDRAEGLGCPSLSRNRSPGRADRVAPTGTERRRAVACSNDAPRKGIEVPAPSQRLSLPLILRKRWHWALDQLWPTPAVIPPPWPERHSYTKSTAG